ncbi:isocitrate dehydrogenase (NAD+) [Chromohalobacter canadensis]|uniref:Isocitrate dehydrogenase (NAD+) n=1 Tax=Chromohalobacter canadensis TaxID=141389 RepID=A0A285VW23_9GAMM|nr:isocitrate dehydrogenase (NAD+) [Chromohalobacter canadensis]
MLKPCARLTWIVARSSVQSSEYDMGSTPYRFGQVLHSEFAANLFGDILSDLCAGLIGGLGLAPGANIGTEAAIFEAVHGSAPDIAGQKLANPCALLLAAADMLDHLGMVEKGARIRRTIRTVLETARDQATPDMGGTGTTETFANALVAHLHD